MNWSKFMSRNHVNFWVSRSLLLAFIVAEPSLWNTAVGQSGSVVANDTKAGPQRFFTLEFDEGTRAKISLRVPSPLTQWEMHQYAALLTLSEAQKQFLNRLFDDYAQS